MSNNLLRGVAAAAGVLAIATSVAAQDKLSKSDREWMEREVGAIITQEEIEKFQSIHKDDRKLFKDLFWMRRDYNPATADNEYRDGYEERIDIADENFEARGRKGSESDMGKIFLLLGSPAEQQRGGVAGEGGLPSTIPPPPESQRGSEGTTPAPVPGDPSGGGSDDTMLWVYQPNASLGIPDGLAIEFRLREQFGYRLANGDDVEEHLENVKERMIANRAISYAEDDNGRLRKADDQFDPNSPAKTALATLRNTGETSSAIAFTATPSYFQASGNDIYIPIDFAISEGTSSGELTFFYAVVGDDGSEKVVEQPVRLTQDAAGRFRYEHPEQLEPGSYTMYVGFVDASGQLGTQVVPLDVPELDARDALTLSSIVMFSEAERTGEVNGVPGKAFLLAGYHFKPKGERVYTHSEQLAGVLNAYNYGVDGGTTNLTMQVAFYKDGEKRGQTEEGPFMVQAPEMALTIFDIPLNIPNFQEPGEYTIEVTVIDHIKNETLKEEIAIVVEGE